MYLKSYEQAMEQEGTRQMSYEAALDRAARLEFDAGRYVLPRPPLEGPALGFAREPNGNFVRWVRTIGRDVPAWLDFAAAGTPPTEPAS